ncbi:MAG: DUF4292 domain-containing protein [Sphingobacteriaceae bacterium]|nr:DUF4292 domain-containing protein [Cytophagaceae bacterium]
MTFRFSLLALLAVVLATAACKRPPSRPAPTADTTSATRSSDFSVQELDFRYLTAKSKLSFKSKEQDIKNASVTIRMKKDSLIWFTVGQLGLTGARGLISRDSVVIVNVLQREVYAFNFAELSQKFGVELNYNLLQSLLVGNLPVERRRRDRVSKLRDYFLLKQDDGKIMVDNYIGERDRKLKKLEVKEQTTNNALKLEFEDFSALNNFLFPYSSLITLDYQSKEDRQQYQTLIQIRHQKVDLTEQPLSFPFSIPSKYARKK